MVNGDGFLQPKDALCRNSHLGMGHHLSCPGRVQRHSILQGRPDKIPDSLRRHFHLLLQWNLSDEDFRLSDDKQNGHQAGNQKTEKIMEGIYS